MHNTILQGDALDVLTSLPAGIAATCVTSPPYYRQRNYGARGQLGQEATPDEYVSNLVAIMREVRRVLRSDGTLWLNLGDSSPHKCLLGIPWRVALALAADGWYLRSEVIWEKPNAQPESVKDRPTRSHEQLFLLSVSERYHYDADAIREPAVSAGRRSGNVARKVAKDGERARVNTHLGSSVPWSDDGRGRNKRDVWRVSTKPVRGVHFATFPPELIKPCILAGAPRGALVLDPFMGSGTTGLVAAQHGRTWLGIELTGEYIEPAMVRITGERPLAKVIEPPAARSVTPSLWDNVTIDTTHTL